MNQIKPFQNQDVDRLINGLVEIGKIDIDEFDLVLTIQQNIVNLDVISRSCAKTKVALAKKYIQRDKNGNFAIDSIIAKNVIYKFSSAENRNTYDSEIEKLESTPVNAKLFPIKTSRLQKFVKKATLLAYINELLIHDVEMDKPINSSTHKPINPSTHQPINP